MPDLQARVGHRRPGRRGPPALGPRRGARGLPRLAAGHRRLRPATGCSSARSGSQTPERLARYLRPDELHTAFNFTYLLASWDAKSLRTAIDDSIDALSAVGAPATWVLSNHDVVRHVTRTGRAQIRTARSRTPCGTAAPAAAVRAPGARGPPRC